jgi:hypothetical protein
MRDGRLIPQEASLSFQPKGVSSTYSETGLAAAPVRIPPVVKLLKTPGDPSILCSFLFVPGAGVLLLEASCARLKDLPTGFAIFRGQNY